ncbi:hypothetical protein [Halococcus sp. AFM35]|uniref:hypothetical protein n=1 Tax=Halococcus sp. AFM35 TaxID=3421653 RepID=UPI003EBD16E8
MSTRESSHSRWRGGRLVRQFVPDRGAAAIHRQRRGLGTAIGPLSSGFLIRFGFVVPSAFGAALAAVAVVLVYTGKGDGRDR